MDGEINDIPDLLFLIQLVRYPCYGNKQIG